ncbi:TetR/AcrR family transcriptional regulator [Sphingobium sp. B2D3C]|uniref:TetR/AcrR family transcriptional regulator n=1 Tax=Sphingobium sp. B2D3C TaxID=2940581 RepID=UPI0022240D30|nr:TetR/AcrR family transcriptional regulator [Sphingobium sp. B2D3C]MCW2397926.1 AcrR family transcriptional regulator [Sphingobium sp. B2D3C]
MQRTTDQQQRPSPRKMPRQARSGETVRAIVEAAARILEEAGLAAFTTNAVAERAGVSIGSLYQYFPSKDALIGALIVRETSQLLKEWEAARTAPKGHETLSMLVEAAVDHQLRRPVLARILDLEEARLPFDKGTLQVTARLHAILLDVLGRPDVAPQDDPETAAQDVLAILKGMVDAAGQRGERDQVTLGRRVRRAVFGYLDSVS